MATWQLTVKSLTGLSYAVQVSSVRNLQLAVAAFVVVAMMIKDI